MDCRVWTMKLGLIFWFPNIPAIFPGFPLHFEATQPPPAPSSLLSCFKTLKLFIDPSPDTDITLCLWNAIRSHGLRFADNLFWYSRFVFARSICTKQPPCHDRSSADVCVKPVWEGIWSLTTSSITSVFSAHLCHHLRLYVWLLVIQYSTSREHIFRSLQFPKRCWIN